jgi:DGQHR domain-containing protein
MILKLIKIDQGSSGAIYSGKISVKELISRHKIDVFNQDDNPNGYQRVLDDKRARKFAAYLSKELKDGRQPVIPTSILLSYRKTIKGTDNGGIFEAVFAEGEPLYVVDGQHRTNGFKAAIEDYGLTQLLNYELPVVIFENTDLRNEVKQFLLINNNMKKVRTDLARELIIKLSRAGEYDISQAESPAIKATLITKLLANELDSPWVGRLSGPGQEKDPKSFNTQLSFANSLKNVLAANPTVKRQKWEDFAKELAKYWQAWRIVAPETFDEPKKYLMTKNNGFVALNSVFADIYSHLRHIKGVSKPTIEEYKEVILKAGDAADSEFWNRENDDGAAGFGGGYGGFSNLAEHILDTMRENGVEF